MTHEYNLDKEPRATINPYVTAGRLILFRMHWDLNPISWLSRTRVRAWKNKFLGKKAVILCNGPSLNKVDFDALDEHDIFGFGLNKINLLFSRADFRPSVIVAVNPHVIEQNAGFYNRTDLPLFLDYRGRKWVKFRDNVHFLHSEGKERQFARDCSISVHQGFTVTYVAMQLAFHMGFKNVGLVGCDHSYPTKGPGNRTVISNGEATNHFDPHYFSSGMKWQLPDLIGSELHYDTAKHTYERYGRRIVNCTEGGHLEIFQRQPLGEFLRS